MSTCTHMHTSYSHTTCTCYMHRSYAHAICIHHTHTSYAYVITPLHRGSAVYCCSCFFSFLFFNIHQDSIITKHTLSLVHGPICHSISIFDILHKLFMPAAYL
uniref:Uncharacterized protein n=1 Tax=Mus musculus TaxID=10090 RepID=Q3TAK2_MOUSE|nr:unnamed protein product [Mus musculus]